MKQNIKQTKIKIKMYNSWFVYNSKAKAITELNLCIAGSEGAEMNRYMTALLEVKNGETLIDTD